MDRVYSVIIHRGKAIYDNLIFTSDAVTENSILSKSNTVKLYRDSRGHNAYIVSRFIVVNKESASYRQYTIRSLDYLCKKENLDENWIFLIRLRTPRKQFLDYEWSDKLNSMVLLYQEVDNAMSWLSTLGGAFSALGDNFGHCAAVAGKISQEQFKLAMRLGDPHLLARCRLYMALSLIQQDQYKRPKLIIENIFSFAKVSHDKVLKKMCQGVWEKLRYKRSLRKMLR